MLQNENTIALQNPQRTYHIADNIPSKSKQNRAEVIDITQLYITNKFDNSADSKNNCHIWL